MKRIVLFLCVKLATLLRWQSRELRADAASACLTRARCSVVGAVRRLGALYAQGSPLMRRCLAHPPINQRIAALLARS